MKLQKFASLVAAASLATAPAIAQSVNAPVAQRIGATSSTSAQKLQGSNGILIGVLAAAAVIAGIIIIADGDDNPSSPG